MTKRYANLLSEILTKNLPEQEEQNEISRITESFLRDNSIEVLDFAKTNGEASANERNTITNIERAFDEELKNNPQIKPFLLRQTGIAYKNSVMGALGRGEAVFKQNMSNNVNRIYSFYQRNPQVLTFLSSFYSEEKVRLTNDFVNEFVGNFVSQKFKNEYKKKIRENIRIKHLQNQFVSKVYFINAIACIGINFDVLAINENDLVMHRLNKNLHLMDMFSKDEAVYYMDPEIESAKQKFLLNIEENTKKYSLLVNETAIIGIDSLFYYLYDLGLPYSQYNIEKAIEILFAFEEDKFKQILSISQTMKRF